MNKSLLMITIFVMGMITASINSANSILSSYIGLLESTVFVHLVGLCVSTLYFIILEKDKKQSLLNVIKTKPYLILGGFVGSIAVVSISYAVQEIGVFVVSTALVAGQFIISFLIDVNGWFGFKKVPLTKRKILSISIMLLGIVLITL